MRTLLGDLRNTIRMLGRSPGFTVVAVLSLALGIGANTAVFSIVDAVLLKFLPVEDPGRLVAFAGEYSYPVYAEFGGLGEAFSGILARCPVPLSMRTGPASERVAGEMVSGNYFRVLGVNAIAGRTFTEDDDRVPGDHPVAVISYRLWQRRFGGAPEAVGSTIKLNGHTYTIAGVTPQNFTSTDVSFAPDVRVPLMMQPQLLSEGNFLGMRLVPWLQVMGRLKPGVPIETAQAAANVQFQRSVRGELTAVPAQVRKMLLDHRVVLSPGGQGVSFFREQYKRPLWVLMAAVMLLVSIACVNLANLLLARAVERRKEIAVRRAIGASRARLVRQLLTESLTVSLLGGALGLLVSVWATHVLLTYLPRRHMPVTLDVSPDMRVLGFTLLLSVITGILFGLAPAIQAARAHPGPALKDDACTATMPRERVALRRTLLVTQVALCVLLLIGAGLFVRSLRNLKGTDSGLVAAKVMTASVDPGLSGYGARETLALAPRLLEQAQSIPGVRSAAVAGVSLMSSGGHGYAVSVEGQPPGQPAAAGSVGWNCVTPGYFKTLGIPLVSGRDFGPEDGPGAPKVAIVTEGFARRFWPNENPIGKHVGAPGQAPDIAVVGVVKDSKVRSLREDTRMVYEPLAQQSRLPLLAFSIRTHQDPKMILPALRERVRAMDPNLPLFDVSTVEERIDASLVQERLLATLSGSFAAVALALAAIGIYGVIACEVARRTREFGVRMALGARRGDVFGMVLRESMAPVGVGLALGWAGAAAASRLVSSLLFGVSGLDAATYAGISALLTAVALLAVWMPAWRAVHADPVAALKHE